MISTSSVIPNKYRLPLLLSLIVAGLAGNYFNFEIFLNIYFLFGSIFAMLALQLLGLGRGIVAAAIIAGYTYVIWNHPYAIIIMTAEVAVVGWLMSRRKIGMVLADTLYWLVIGIPLIYLFYHVVMHVPPSNTYIFMTKQAVNGIANALFARLIFTAYAIRSRSSLSSYSETIYNLLAFFVLCPTLIVLAVDGRTDFALTDRLIRTGLIQDNRRVVLALESWVYNRKTAITNLAELSASRSPQQMQLYLELTDKSDVNFGRISLVDKNALSTAFSPLIDELGQNNIGRNYADRPFIPILKQTLKPMLSEISMAKLGIPKPRVLMLAPVVIRGEYCGFIAGALDLQQIQDYLDKSGDLNKSLYTLLDKNGNVIMSNRTDQTVMKPFVQGKGALNRLDEGVSQWVPTVPPNTPVSERWKKSFYVVESTVGDLAEWKLILEQPVAPFQKRLYDNFTGKLTLLFMLLLVSLALAEFISRKIVVTLSRLRMLTRNLPVRLATDGKDVVWPDSGFKEVYHLMENFREMADSLSGQFIVIRQINENLEQQVEERTKELRESEAKYRLLTEDASDVAWQLDCDGRFTYISPADERLRGYSADEIIGQTCFEQMTKEGCALVTVSIRDRLEAEQEGTRTGSKYFEMHLRCKNGGHIWVENCSIPDRDTVGTITGFHGIYRDITKRKQVEKALHESNKELDCLYSIISLSNDPGISFDELLKRAVMRTPPAWQFPDITEACIEIGEKSFQTARFEETPWMLVNEIIAQDNKVGKVTVCYLEEQMFSPEELTLLNAIAEKLGLIVMRESARETILRLAVTDELTGLNNRRFFNENLTKAVSTAWRHKQPLSLISIDIDHFKMVNDAYGHTVGDLVLKEFSQLLKMLVRVEDIACRWGGEEFIVLLPNTTGEAALILANRMRCSFEQHPRTTTPTVTASFGVARLQEGEDEDALMRRVDDALYQAKHEGRNRVVAACDSALS